MKCLKCNRDDPYAWSGDMPCTGQYACVFCGSIAPRWYSDPGHAWLRVPLELVENSGADISAYSYKDKDFAYLEEDSDAWKFLKTIKGIERLPSYPRNVYSDNESFIRRLPRM